jgi:hypothetical protein
MSYENERYGVVKEADGRYTVIDKQAEGRDRFVMEGSRAAAHKEAGRLNAGGDRE